MAFIGERPRIPHRWQRVIDRLRERPYTVKELAEALDLTPKVVRKYLIAISKDIDIHREFRYGATTYRIKARDQ